MDCFRRGRGREGTRRKRRAVAAGAACCTSCGACTCIVARLPCVTRAQAVSELGVNSDAWRWPGSAREPMHGPA